MTATALSEVRNLLGGEKFPGCESPSLRLEKFVRIGGDNTKREEIDAVVACQRKNGKEPVSSPLPPGGVRFPARLKSRLIVNQAGGILENAGMCLHPHFGYPYIPGSAVKGIARHAAWCAWHEAEEPEKETIARNIALVFGYPTNDKGLDAYLEERGYGTKRGGCISFWAAEPDGKVNLATDIVNCHHMKYYGGDDPSTVATDDESPNPQFFPAVEKDCTFLFTLVPLRDADKEKVGLAKEWLIQAITENGAGAKTSAGYGWFEYEDLENVKVDVELLKDWDAKYVSGTRQKKVFFVDEKLAEIATRPAEFRRTVLEFFRSKDWWTKEKKNTGSKITQLVNDLAEEFGLEGEV